MSMALEGICVAGESDFKYVKSKAKVTLLRFVDYVRLCDRFREAFIEELAFLSYITYRNAQRFQ